LLRGLDVRVASETGTPVISSERPLQSVVLGAGMCLEEFERLREVLSTTGTE
jgi:rod shape-determining protein MreB